VIGASHRNVGPWDVNHVTQYGPWRPGFRRRFGSCRQGNHKVNFLDPAMEEVTQNNVCSQILRASATRCPVKLSSRALWDKKHVVAIFLLPLVNFEADMGQKIPRVKCVRLLFPSTTQIRHGLNRKYASIKGRPVLTGIRSDPAGNAWIDGTGTRLGHSSSILYV
jgi:hypothetical protein